MLLYRKQEDVDLAARDYGYIEYLRKSMVAGSFSKTAPDIYLEESMLNLIRLHESKRDYFTASLRPVNHLVQIDEMPNHELMEPKWELYKISISFQRISKFDKNLIDLILTNFVDDSQDVPSLKGSKHRVFFQNVEGSINMGVFFNDPDVDLDEIFWYNELAEAMNVSLRQNDGLISIDKELNTRSCYVELHRKG